MVLGVGGLLWVVEQAAMWVFAIGGMRYAFVVAPVVWPGLAAPLPPSERRKTVCVWQVGSLLVCLLPGVRVWLGAWQLHFSVAGEPASFAESESLGH